MDQAYSLLSTTHGHITDCKLCRDQCTIPSLQRDLAWESSLLSIWSGSFPCLEWIPRVLVWNSEFCFMCTVPQWSEQGRNDQIPELGPEGSLVLLIRLWSYSVSCILHWGCVYLENSFSFALVPNPAFLPKMTTEGLLSSNIELTALCP